MKNIRFFALCGAFVGASLFLVLELSSITSKQEAYAQEPAAFTVSHRVVAKAIDDNPRVVIEWCEENLTQLQLDSLQAAIFPEMSSKKQREIWQRHADDMRRLGMAEDDPSLVDAERRRDEVVIE